MLIEHSESLISLSVLNTKSSKFTTLVVHLYIESPKKQGPDFEMEGEGVII